MITIQSFSIRFILLKKRAKEGLTPLYYRITINGERAEGSANRSVPIGLWDAKAQRVTGKSELAKDVNTQIEAIRTSLHNHQSRLVTLGKIVTAQLLKNEFLGITTDRKSLGDAFEFLIKRKKELLAKKKLSTTTVEKYEKSYSYLKEFMRKEYKVTDIPLFQISPSFIEDFAHYLLTKCDIGNNTAMKKIANVKSAFILAHNRGWIKTNPTATYKCTLEEKDPIRLEIDELYTIYSKKIKNQRLSEIRDCYVFMCFTGYAYSDARNLIIENLFKGPDGNLWVTKDRQKTDTTECVPLFPAPIDIINKYSDSPIRQQTGKLLPIKSNQKYNAYLKEIAAICNINKELTTHTARHTFATTVTLENGIPLETVSKMLGHKSVKTTQRYARVTRKKIMENMAVLKTRLFGKKQRFHLGKAVPSPEAIAVST